QGLAAVAGVAVGLLALPRLVAANPLWWMLLPALLAVLAPLARPSLLGHLLRLGQRLLRPAGAALPLPPPGILLRPTGLMALGWVISGAHIAALAIALGAPPDAALTIGIGGFALSVVAGVLTLVLPSGIGAREVVLGLTLATILSGPSLVTVVALSRALITVVDMASTGVVLVLLSVRDHAARRREQPAATALVPSAAVAEGGRE